MHFETNLTYPDNYFIFDVRLKSDLSKARFHFRKNLFLVTIGSRQTIASCGKYITSLFTLLLQTNTDIEKIIMFQNYFKNHKILLNLLTFSNEFHLEVYIFSRQMM